MLIQWREPPKNPRENPSGRPNIVLVSSWQEMVGRFNSKPGVPQELHHLLMGPFPHVERVARGSEVGRIALNGKKRSVRCRQEQPGTIAHKISQQPEQSDRVMDVLNDIRTDQQVWVKSGEAIPS